jgi:hypothetical protein
MVQWIPKSDNTKLARDYPGQYTAGHRDWELRVVMARFRITSVWLALFVSGAVLSGCVVIERNINAWEGHQIDELIEAWGEPTSITALGPDYIAYSWADTDDNCQQTFTARGDKIIGVSDTGCSS